MTLAAYIPTGPLALLVSLALLGLGCVVTFMVACLWMAWVERCDRRRKESERGGFVPEHVHRQIREPSRTLPNSHLTDTDLERWPVLPREPR